MKIITESGFECEVNEKIKNDWRFVNAMAKASDDNGDIEKLDGYMQMAKLLLGKEEERLCKHVQEEDGTVPLAEMNKEILDIIKKMGEELKKQ